MDIHKKFKYIQKNHIFTTLKQKYILKKEKYLKLQNLKKNKKQKKSKLWFVMQNVSITVFYSFKIIKEKIKNIEILLNYLVAVLFLIFCCLRLQLQIFRSPPSDFKRKE